MITELCQLYGCKKTHATPYQPQGRFNQTLLSLLGTLEAEQQQRWVEYLPSVIQAYNNSVHSSTGYAPTYLMFGRHVRLPIDLVVGTAGSEGVQSTSEWVGQHHTRLEYAYNRVSDHLGATAARNKHQYDRTAGTGRGTSSSKTIEGVGLGPKSPKNRRSCRREARPQTQPTPSGQPGNTSGEVW